MIIDLYTNFTFQLNRDIFRQIFVAILVIFENDKKE